MVERIEDALSSRSHAVLPQDKQVLAWAMAAKAAGAKVLSDPAEQAKWLRHGKTWFVGVDALPNDADGAIDGVPLSGPWEGHVEAMPLHPAQLSVVFPGYPKQDPDESDAAHRFRKERCAAHLDGLLRVGPENRRYLKEPHAWILGLPLTDVPNAPLVVWEGSHEIIREAFMVAFAGMPPSMWGEIDVTDIYKDARREVFELCEPREVKMVPGQSVILHRLSIHGVAPWGKGLATEPRMVAYFRPLMEEQKDWLRAP
jgi:hypothetical protein